MLADVLGLAFNFVRTFQIWHSVQDFQHLQEEDLSFAVCVAVCVYVVCDLLAK